MATYSRLVIEKAVNQLMEENDSLGILTHWEQDFIYDMQVRLSKEQEISEKQRNKVVEIFNRAIVNATHRDRGW